MFRNFYIFEPIVKKCLKIDNLGNKWKNLSKPIYLQGFPVISLLWVCFPISLIQAKIVSKNQKLTPSNTPSNSPKPIKTQKFCQYFRKLLFFSYISFKDIELPQPTYISNVFCKFFLKLSKNNCRKIWRLKQRPQIFAVSMVQSPAIQRAWHSKTSALYIMRHRLFRAEEQSSSPAEYSGHGTTLLQAFSRRENNTSRMPSP